MKSGFPLAGRDLRTLWIVNSGAGSAAIATKNIEGWPFLEFRNAKIKMNAISIQSTGWR